MDPDIFLTVGIVLGVFSLPSLMAAWVEGRAPRVGAIMILAAMALVVAAFVQKPGGYALDDVPEAMLSTLGRILR
ncbi:hypothetical protein [Pseudogemmobacter sonorensis]|uniref:hypothetical protein n=1 Tax=Pseudogemmobacter sonorensis TaxID=2989681 RepID=UPI0036880DC8